MVEIKRRSFLASMLAAAAAPTFVKSGGGVLMPVNAGYLEERRVLAFSSGPKTLMRGDTLIVTTYLALGTLVSEYCVMSGGVCTGADVYGRNFPTQKPRGTAALVEMNSKFTWDGDAH